MEIKDIGGEFELIRRMTGNIALPENVICGVGDDCAVLEFRNDEYLLVTADMMVENDHFSLKWQTPYQIGMKLMEVNVSDIHSMGGKPTFAFLSMSLTKNVSYEFVEDFYRGLYQSAALHGVTLLGGDTTHGTELVFNITLLGTVAPRLLTLRSGAHVGDVLCVTGTLGASTSGLKILLRSIEGGYLLKHKEPKARLYREAVAIAEYATAMIDVSDGLGSETKHICTMSNTGAVILYDKIPISDETRTNAKRTGEDPCDYALYGGEDFELVFTIAPENIPLLRENFSDFTEVGKIVSADDGVTLEKNGSREQLKKGYDHFA